MSDNHRCGSCPHTTVDHRFHFDKEGNFFSECLIDPCKCPRMERRGVVPKPKSSYGSREENIKAAEKIRNEMAKEEAA